jgi:hypothetical protein
LLLRVISGWTGGVALVWLIRLRLPGVGVDLRQQGGVHLAQQGVGFLDAGRGDAGVGAAGEGLATRRRAGIAEQRPPVAGHRRRGGQRAAAVYSGSWTWASGRT